VRSVLENIATAKARGVVLSVLTAGAGYMFYLAIGEPDPTPPPGDAVSVPLVRAEAIDTPPSPLRVIPETPLPVTAPPAPADRASLARDLQKALAKAQCYDGPITGKWTVASKDAMGAFLVTVNAQLPVDSPDPALLALVTSNDGATCAPKRPLYTGTVTPPSPPSTAAADEPPRLQTDAPLVPASAERRDEPQASVDDRPMLERGWAPPEMLVPPKDLTPPDPVAAPLMASNTETPSGPDVPPASAPPSITRSASPIPPPASVPVTSSPVTPAAFGTGDTLRDAKPDAAPKAEPPPKTAQRKSKAKKRRPSDYDDVSTSITKSWESMQRSLSSIFD
jgi:hypothetical protein